ncbi:MAG: cell division protein ZapA [Desulfotignum sp.]|nr:cell division protein ZapA [Desulfotignum sp.]
MDEIIKIDLFGEEFRFKPDDQVKNPKKVVQSLTDYIQEAERMVPNKNSARNKMAILLLAAINLSKDHHELKMQYAEREKDMEKKISSLMNKIDNGL